METPGAADLSAAFFRCKGWGSLAFGCFDPVAATESVMAIRQKPLHAVRATLSDP